MDTTEHLLAPLADDAPCGPNLEYDADFLKLDALAAPRPERAVGDAVKQAEEPEWREVLAQADALATRTRDVRIAIHLAMAWMKTAGVPAWSRGIGLVRDLLERYWDDVHPRLEDGDPVERINALAAISAADGMFGYLRHVPVLRAERVGSFCLRDVRAMNGSLRGNDDAVVRADASPEAIEAVMQNVDDASLLEVDTAVAGAIDHLDAIGRLFDERTPGMGPDFEALRRELRELHGFLHAQVTVRMPQAAQAEPEAVVDDTAPEALHAPGRGPIRGTDDVCRMLDEICAWYAQHEPSSPVRPMLRRARGLVGLGFGELLRAIAPGGYSEFQQLAGDGAE
ncbi:type VI secretion system protein TssA [Luteibacter sp. CQ10]|uniref:type VI secretion system protein TssA n=1 Tax=Luteibacter sp. CQ10 TaxID=2805821 RepID=UPI0034A43235